MNNVRQFNIASGTVSSTTKLGTCHIAGYALLSVLFHCHPPPSHSVELFFAYLSLARSKVKLGASCLEQNVKEGVSLDIHL
jgi:hypothetical protein